MLTANPSGKETKEIKEIKEIEEIKENVQEMSKEVVQDVSLVCCQPEIPGTSKASL